ncbi:MAG: hypothetical protein PHP20_06250 [Firmicutes bacterium]|nr:hypothetical protein [Bacillota bacterium]MDD4792651.1 hypothetical protein [Bacillota bacterium]
MIRSAAIAMLISLSGSLILLFAIYRFFWHAQPLGRETAILIMAASTSACAITMAHTFFSGLSWARSNCMTAAIVSLVAAFSYPSAEDAQLGRYSSTRTGTKKAGNESPEQTEPASISRAPSTAIPIVLVSWLRRVAAGSPSLRAVGQFLRSQIARLRREEPLQTQHGALQGGNIGCIAGIALDYGIDIAFDWSSPLILTPFVEWTESSIDDALNSVMRLLTLPQVAEDEIVRSKLVQMQRCLHAARASLRLRNSLSPNGKGLFDERLRERVSRLNIMLGGGNLQ